VDEPSASATDYLQSSSNSKKETFTFQNTVLTTETINSVTIHYYAKRYSSSKYKIQPMIRVGSQNYLGSVIDLTSGYQYYSGTFTLNPSTGQAWTAAQVDALEAGMSTYSASGGAYIAQVYAVVDYNPTCVCHQLKFVIIKTIIAMDK